MPPAGVPWRGVLGEPRQRGRCHRCAGVFVKFPTKEPACVLKTTADRGKRTAQDKGQSPPVSPMATGCQGPRSSLAPRG